MTTLEKYLALDSTFVAKALQKALYIKDFWKSLGINSMLRHDRGYEEFESYFGIDIAKQIAENLKNYKKQCQLKEFAIDRICKNPTCAKHFTWADSHYPFSDFCSKTCAMKFSASHINKKKISEKIHELNKQNRIIPCSHCGKMIKVPYCTVRKICDECLAYTGKCKICGKPLTSKRRRQKTCSNKCARILRNKSFHTTQQKYHRCGGYRINAGHGKHGWYKGIWCDSSWELAWVIYHIDHGIVFERNKKGFDYTFNGIQHKYYPDFKLADGTYVEIKGFQYPNWDAKQQLSIPLRILYKKDLTEIFEYVKAKYGSNWKELYDNSKPSKDISKQKYVWINNGQRNKVISPKDLDSFKNQGWVQGRISNAAFG